MDSDTLGDRLKFMESLSVPERFLPLLPICVRIDGRHFSSFTRGMQRPYNQKMSKMMIDTTHYLAQETNSILSYTQSDEISLCFYQTDHKSQVFFDGRVSKIISSLAAMASVYFYKLCTERLPDYSKKLPTFDCRAWVVPNLAEAANVFLWRELDATKNAITMAASCVYSHNELMHKNGSEKQEMLFSKGINFNDYPSFFKRGTYIQRKKVLRRFTPTEIENLPLLHEARKNPDLQVERSDYFELEMPPFSKVINREEVLLGADPKIS